jgi:protein-S-isoprenylcysteine O-methyltransferase Ste14
MDPAAELPFRVVFGLLLILGLAVRMAFQRRAKGIEKVTRLHARRERFFYNLVLATYLLMFVYLFSPWLDFAYVPLPTAVRWLGAGVLVLGTWLFWWTHRTLGSYWSGVLELRRDHRLIAEGPYARVRHPMYTAFFITGLGLALLSANWLLAVCNLGALTWMCAVRIPAEEAMLLECFGDQYRRYMGETGRLLPPLRPGARAAKRAA